MILSMKIAAETEASANGGLEPSKNQSPTISEIGGCLLFSAQFAGRMAL